MKQSLILLLVLMLLSAAPNWAQVETSTSIRGLITDASGAAVPSIFSSNNEPEGGSEATAAGFLSEFLKLRTKTTARGGGNVGIA